MEEIHLGRVLVGDSLGFHIIFVGLSIGLPFLISIFEWYAWRKNDDNVRGLIRLLARWAAVFVITGVMSGTIIALQFSTLWAPFMDAARPHVGKFFQLESYMFLIEAVFLAWYFATMKEVGSKKHFLISLPINLGAIGSAFFITMVNAWMNNPTGIWTTTTTNEILHSVTSYFFATTLVLLGYLAWRTLRKPSKNARVFLQWSINRVAIIAAVLMVLLGILGHQSAVDIAHTQPHKLAAIELLDETQTNAPMRIGGSMNDDGKAEGGIIIPGLLSLLAGNSFDTTVKGLGDYPRDRWPLLVVHLLFDIKMALVGVASAMIAGALFFYWRKREQPRWFAVVLAALGSIGLVMVELGWMLTELGRQPWAINGKLLTADAFTKGVNMMQTGIIFPSLFVLLTIATAFALHRTTRQWRKKEKMAW